MKKTMKRILSMFMATVMIVCTFSITTFAEESTTAINFASAGVIDGTQADNVVDTGIYQYKIGVAGGQASYFQYQMPALAENEVITSAKWEAITSNTTAPVKYVKLVKFDTKNLLTASETTYNSLVAAGYNDSATPVWTGLTSDISTMVYPNGLSTQYAKLSVDVTSALNAAVNAGDPYFSFVVSGTTAFVSIDIPKAWSPRPQLVITTKTVEKAKVELTNPANGTLTTKENTAFNVSANITEGSSEISNVSLEVKNSAGNAQTVSAPSIIGNTYTWNFASGLAAGTYNAVLKVTDADGNTTEENITINVQGAMKLSYLSAGVVDAEKADTAVDSSVYQWKISPAGKTASYFQYELPTLGANETITSAKWEAFTTSTSLPSKLMKAVEFNTNSIITASSATYNSIIAAGYNDGATPIWSGNASEITALAYPDGLTTQYAKISLDVTEAIKTAIVDGDPYFSFVVSGTNAYNEILIPKAWSPKPQIIINTAVVPEITVSNKTITAKENTAFTVNATIQEGSSAISSVVLEVEDSTGASKETGTLAINGNSYTWTFANGLVADTYTAIIKVTDADGVVTKETVTINVVGTTSVNKSSVSSDGLYNAQFNINLKGWSSWQYDLGSMNIPENATITGATWYFGFQSAPNWSGTEMSFYKQTSQNVYGNAGATSTITADTTFAAEPFVTKEFTGYANSLPVKDAATASEGYFLTVDMTNAVKSAFENGEQYFGFSVGEKGHTTNYFDTDLIMAKSNGAYYWPTLMVEYTTYTEPVAGTVVANHILNVVNGTATATVDVTSGAPVLILASYVGDKLESCVIADEIVGNKLTATLTNTTAGAEFKSFVWENMSTLKPVTDIISK